jgi:hypothetical protein
MRSRRPQSFFDMTDAEIDERNAARASANERRSELREIARRHKTWRGKVAAQILEGILPEDSLWVLELEFSRIAAEERRTLPPLRPGSDS